MIPDLSVSIIDRCKTIRLEDSSGLGSDGWDDGTTGVDNTTVTEAKIYFVTGPSGATMDTIDVTDAITSADPLYGDFLLTGAAGTYPDGLYELKYQIVYGETATNTIEFWGYCNAEFGRDKMYAKYSQMLEDDAKEQYLDDAYNIDRLIRSMKSAISSVNTNSLSYQQKVIDKILEFNNVPKAY